MKPAILCFEIIGCLFFGGLSRPEEVRATEIPAAAASVQGRPRVMVETDAGGDPDDEQSMVRFLLYTNEFDVAGIIVNRVLARDGENLNPERTGLGIVRRLLRAYAECFERLREHDDRYPSAESLQRCTVSGAAESDDGVRLVIKAVDSDDARPLWFLNWGTDHGSEPSALRRALDRVMAERDAAGYREFKSRLRLSGDDQFGEHTYNVAPPFPRWENPFRPELDRKRCYHRFSAITATAGGFDVERDVRTGHGPLGALYPVNTTHRQKEGDSMSFLYLVPTGMNDPHFPDRGSWAGRYGRRLDVGERNYFHANQVDDWRGSRHRENSLARWAVDLQNDFRARLDWCVQSRALANHPPQVILAGNQERHVQPGQEIVFDLSDSVDPDGDTLQFHWELYPPPAAIVAFPDSNESRLHWVVPQLEVESLHVVCTVRDSGSPPLARYARWILHTKP